MQVYDADYERIGRWLDGEAVELTAAERAVADEIRRDELLLDAPIDGRGQHEAMARARRRLSAELGRPRRRKLVLAALTGVEAAAVAALLVMVWTFHVVSNGNGPPSIMSLEMFVQVTGQTDGPEEMDLIEDELDRLRAEMLVELPEDDSDAALEDLQEQLDELWLDGPPDIWAES